jgi:thiol-disulfide isomerase/thioredoxin
MKRTIIISLVVMLAFASSVSAQHKGSAPTKKEITVKGKLQFTKDPFNRTYVDYGIRLSKGKGDKKVEIMRVIPDAAGNFSFKVDASIPQLYNLSVYGLEYVDFWACKDNLTINVRGVDTCRYLIKNPPFVYIEGSEDNNVLNLVNQASYLNYQRMILTYQEDYKAGQSKDTIWHSCVRDNIRALSKDLNDRIRLIVKMYKDRPTVLFAVNMLDKKKDRELMLSTYDVLIKKFPWFTEAKEAKESFIKNENQEKLLELGAVAPEFSFPNLDGKMVNLKDLRGKLLIVDFWASWCGPCRQETPNVKAVYDKYKDKGLEVLSVSIDKKENEWKKAVEEDKLTWLQLNAKDSKKLMQDYQFSGIPYIILLDKDGKFVAKNIRGDKIEEAVKKALTL